MADTKVRRGGELENASQQGRFDEGSALWAGILDLGRRTIPGCPNPDQDVQGYDHWMQLMLKRGPVLPGMVAKVIGSAASRGWNLLGGRNTVIQTKEMLNFADDGRGWYAFVESLARSFYTRNMGAFVELQRRFAPEFDEMADEWSFQFSQVCAIYNMDSTKVRWRKDRNFPITFENRRWGRFDFFHVVANPGDTDQTRHIGNSPLALCMQNLALMILIWEWEQGNLDPDFIDALLLLSGAEEEQLGQAFRAREQAIEEKGNAAKRLGVIANLNGEIQAELLFLRRRPESLEDFERRIRLIYEVYAMNLGKDVTFFFPTAFGSLLGRSAREVTTIERVADEANIFHPKVQEALQKWVIPRTSHFEFVDNSVSETEDIARLKELAGIGKTLFEAERTNQVDRASETTSVEHLATRDEVRALLGEKDKRFSSWTPVEEDVTVTDEEGLRSLKQLRELPQMEELIVGYRAGHYLDDQLIRYEWRVEPESQKVVDGAKPPHRERVRYLPWSVEELARRQVWPVPGYQPCRAQHVLRTARTSTERHK